MKTFAMKAFSTLSIVVLSGCAVYVRDNPGLGMGHRRGGVVAVSGPRLVLVTGTSIKYCPDEDEDIFFYSGRWYLFRGGVWFYGARHTGPWKGLGQSGLPQVFVNIPRGHFKHHKGNWHPAQGPGGHPGLGKGHDKDEDGVDDHENKKGKGHGKH